MTAPKKKPGRKRHHPVQGTKGADGLNDAQRRFADSYVEYPNQTQAAIKAGYSRKSARQQGAELLKHPAVSAYIAEKQAEIARRLGLNAETARKELATLSYSDVRNYLVDGQPLPVELAPGAPEGAMRAVSAVKVREVTVTHRDGTTETTRTVEFKLHEKNPALANLMKHLGMLRETPRQVNVGVVLYLPEKEPLPEPAVIDLPEKEALP